jgi:hypothetical protein
VRTITERDLVALAANPAVVAHFPGLAAYRQVVQGGGCCGAGDVETAVFDAAGAMAALAALPDAQIRALLGPGPLRLVYPTPSGPQVKIL